MTLTLEQRIEILEEKMRFVKYLMWEQYYKCGSSQLYDKPKCNGCMNHGACVFATDYGIDQIEKYEAELRAQKPDVDNKLTEEELTATPMNDLRIVSEIKEKYPKRFTKDINNPPSDYYKLFLETYNRLADIEDIIYGEENEQ